MAKNKLRLDNALVEQGFFASRNRAQASIMAGEVLVNNQVETRADRSILPEDQITLKEKSCPYVSRGGLKLAHALTHWHIDLKDKVCVDIGVATGGFSDCMLQAGAKTVYGVDVGKGQLADEMRRYSNFIFKPETNARYMTPDLFDTPPQFAAVDVSFISLTMIMEPLFRVMAKPGEIVFLIKPQFELTPKQVPHGIVKTDENRQLAIKRVQDFFEENLRLKYNAVGGEVIESPIKGTHGNTEFLWHVTIQ
ncbi:MAG: TlyA family RNA methyltransferase [Elusimicrobiaceae bacterium]|nr:TlyA family RNA methyltransferase [Elusimicrobiaceae bacterium]MBP5617399.1 TlyA family RNA methyltransferase [Elusimicrobiaceae bacterium]